jgi:hypothetical protein
LKVKEQEMITKIGMKQRKADGSVLIFSLYIYIYRERERISYSAGVGTQVLS